VLNNHNRACAHPQRLIVEAAAGQKVFLTLEVTRINSSRLIGFSQDYKPAYLSLVHCALRAGQAAARALSMHSLHAGSEPDASGGSQPGVNDGGPGSVLFAFGEDGQQEHSSAPGGAARKRRGSRGGGGAASEEQEAKLRRQQMLNKAAQQRYRCVRAP